MTKNRKAKLEVLRSWIMWFGLYSFGGLFLSSVIVYALAYSVTAWVFLYIIGAIVVFFYKYERKRVELGFSGRKK